MFDPSEFSYDFVDLPSDFREMYRFLASTFWRERRSRWWPGSWKRDSQCQYEDGRAPATFLPDYTSLAVFNGLLSERLVWSAPGEAPGPAPWATVGDAYAAWTIERDRAQGPY